MTESDKACEVDFAVEHADDTETKELKPIVVIDRCGWSEERRVKEGNKKRKRNTMIRKVRPVNPDHRLYIIHYGGPRLLPCEIEKLHPDIVSVKALRQKGRYIATFQDEMKRNKALEDLSKTQIEGKLKVFKCSADHKMPFLSPRPESFDIPKKRRKRCNF